jgi:flagellar protein FliS
MQESIDRMYRQGDLLSATPQRLQYLLVDGAIRFAKQAGRHWQDGDFEQGGEAMDRCEAILAEILKNIRIEHWAVADQIAGLYVFLLTSATEAHFRHDTEQLEKVVSVLETERETWRALCESPIDAEACENTDSSSETQFRGDSAEQATAPPIVPPLETQTGSSSFSLEA